MRTQFLFASLLAIVLTGCSATGYTVEVEFEDLNTINGGSDLAVSVLTIDKQYDPNATKTVQQFRDEPDTSRGLHWLVSGGTKQWMGQGEEKMTLKRDDETVGGFVVFADYARKLSTRAGMKRTGPGRYKVIVGANDIRIERK